MKPALIGFLLGVVVGAAGITTYLLSTGDTATAKEVERSEGAVEKARESLVETVDQTGAAVEAKLETLELRAEDVEKDMEEMGRVVRRRARDLGEEVSDAADDTRITAQVKAKLIADEDLPALDISVDVADGRVTLSGTVPRAELVGEAMLLAYETEGVREVVSTILVESER
jgi:osmotically-inducible protein OsmY